MAASVLAAGHELIFYDTAYTPTAEVIDEVSAGDTEVFLISAGSLFVQEARELAAGVKSKNPFVTVILGGLHATIDPVGVLRDIPEIDFVCVGEGEQFIEDFLSRKTLGLLLNDLKNLGYRDQSGVPIINPVGPPTELDSLPDFPYHLFDPASVVLNDGPLPGFAYVSATRGCPYACSYCCNKVYLDLYPKGAYLRKTDVNIVVNELLRLKRDHPVKTLFFGDEMILFDADYCEELFRKVHRDVKLPYGCMARVERIDQRMTDLLRETDCRYVGMGIECGDEEFRREFLRRKMTNDQIIKAFRLLRTIPCMILTSYNMRGFPVSYDDRLTESTVKINKIVAPNIVQWTTFYPFPGTELHRYCVEHDLIDPKKSSVVGDVFSESVLRKPT